MLLIDDNFKKQFNSNLYQIETPIFITSDHFWDGGINSSFSLEEKSSFYNLAKKMSSVLKEFVIALNEELYIADFLCENEKMYADWSDLKKKELFRIVSNIFKKKKCYKLSVVDDSNLIDLIVESNFNYLTFFSFYLPKSNIIIQPTCHTELILYSENSENPKSILKDIIEKYDVIKLK